MDSLLDDQPDWLQVIDSCLCNRLTQYRLIIMIKAWEGTGGGGVLNQVLCWEAPPQGPTPYPFIYHFWQKSYFFRIPLTDQIVHLSHT